MTLKTNWSDGDTFTAADANAIAAQINTNTNALIGGGTIGPGSVTLANLVSSVQATLAKADSALQSVPANSVASGQITDGSVALADLATAIQTSLARADTALQTIANNSVGSTQIADGSVSLADLTTSLQSAVALANTAMQTIAAGSVGSTQIADGGVALVDLVGSVQTSLGLANTALQSVPVNSVGSAQITDGTVGLVDLTTALQAGIALAGTALQPATADTRYADVASNDHGPMGGVLTQLQHNRSAVVQGIGDSTMYGGGWLALLFDRIASSAGWDANLWHRQWNDATQAYDPPTVRRVSTQGERTVTTTGTQWRAPTLTGDFEVTVKCTPTAWTSAQYLVSKSDVAGNQRGWYFGLDASGHLTLNWSTDGNSGTLVSAVSTVVVPFTANTAGWVRVSVDVDNGSAGYSVRFYTSTDGSTWTQLGSTVTNSGVTSIFNTTALYQLGSKDNTTISGPFTGSFSYVSVRDALTNGVDVVPNLPEKWLSSSVTSGSVAGGPLILIMNGSWGGKNLVYFDDNTRRPRLLAGIGADVAFVTTGHNDGLLTPDGFSGNYLRYLRHVKSWRPHVPIIVNTQNPTKIGSAVPAAANVQSGLARSAAMARVMAAEPGVTVLDTHQAFTDLSTQINDDGLHPSSPIGYQAEADWLARRLAPKTML